MAKRHLPVRIDETPPEGPITVANPPLPVHADVVWGFLGPSTLDHAWAMAWTREQVLVFYMDGGGPTPILVWLRADQVKRR